MIQLFVFLSVLAISNPASAAETAPATSLSKEAREKMAAAHEKMAQCLRSGKDFSTCHDELMSECQAQMGGTCPCMGMHKGPGMGMRKHMQMKK